ncbi:MAG TPA: 2OG-Fe dioxygenase family protein [Methyloradius sp.]
MHDLIHTSAKDTLCPRIEQSGFCFTSAEQVREWLTQADTHALDDWKEFAESWNEMPIDEYMADGGRYRRRRHATLSAENSTSEIKLEPHQPHYQSLDYNTLNGGIPRNFAPIDMSIIHGHTMHSLLYFCQSIFGQMLPQAKWHIECHQFRIEASSEAHGKPTPEGVHRDGVDFVLVMMVKRVNISSGTTTMHDNQQRTLDSFTLTQPLDCAIVNDKRCMHGVTPVEQIDPTQPAYRDVLVITFKNLNIQSS